MERRTCVSAILAFSLLGCAFCAPAPGHRFKRATDDDSINIEENSVSNITSSTTPETTPDPFDDDDDFYDFGESESTPSEGGSNIFSLLRVVTALFSGSSASQVTRNLLRNIRMQKQMSVPSRRQFVNDNGIKIHSISGPKPSYQRQENNDDDSYDRSESETQESEEDSVEEDSEENVNDDIDNGSKQDPDSNLDTDGDKDNNDSDYDSDEPPGGGDGGGGGILGLLAGLSGGEDGSDLGTLLATVSGIVANLSGDGIDLNSLIASGIGLFVGLLSEGEENPGAVIASYLLTSLDTITGGGAKNNGEFFGTFLSKLIKGTSAAGDPDASSEDDAKIKPMADSAGFFASLLISLLGDMSKSISGGSSHPWR